jgi:transposase-like protein
MIKLICPQCQDDELHEIKENDFDEWFRCDYCGKEFTFQDADWENEN